MSESIEFTADTRLRIIQEAERLLGPEAFNKLVDSVPSTLEKGRLRFWQEQLLEQLSREANLCLSMGEFVAVFRDAPRRMIPKILVPKEEFLRTPNRFLYSGRRYDIPEVWVIEALQSNPEFWENYSYEFVREADKNGDLA